MATKFSELTAAGALTGAEVVPVLQGGANRRTTVADIIAEVDLSSYATSASVASAISAALADYTPTASLGDLATLDTVTASLVSDFAAAVDARITSPAIIAALGYTPADAADLADYYTVTEVNTLLDTDYYTAAEVDTLLEGVGGASQPFADDTALVKNAADATKLVRLSAASVTAGQTRVLTAPDANGTLAVLGLAQTWTAAQTFSSVSVPGTGSNSEGFGAGISLSGVNNATAVGNSASANSNGTAVGMGAAANGNPSIAIGRSSAASVNELVAGSGNCEINSVYFGKGKTSSSPTTVAIKGTGGQGTNVAGGALSLCGGAGTGNAAGGDVKLEVSLPGSSGSSANAVVTAMRVAALSSAARVVWRVASSAIADADLANNEGSLYIDAGAVKLKHKDNSGVVTTYTLT